MHLHSYCLRYPGRLVHIHWWMVMRVEFPDGEQLKCMNFLGCPKHTAAVVDVLL